MSISIQHTEPEQVLLGSHNGKRVIVLGVQNSQDAAEACWLAATKLVELLYGNSTSPAMVVDIPNATVRHAFITEIGEQ